jgi:hypothetical protein
MRPGKLPVLLTRMLLDISVLSLICRIMLAFFYDQEKRQARRRRGSEPQKGRRDVRRSLACQTLLLLFAFFHLKIKLVCTFTVKQIG